MNVFLVELELGAALPPPPDTGSVDGGSVGVGDGSVGVTVGSVIVGVGSVVESVESVGLVTGDTGSVEDDGTESGFVGLVGSVTAGVTALSGVVIASESATAAAGSSS